MCAVIRTLSGGQVGSRRFVVRAGDDLGRAVAEIRRHRRLTQHQLADRAGLDRTRLARLESGHRTIALDDLMLLLRRLGATVTVTFEDSDAEA